MVRLLRTRIGASHCGKMTTTKVNAGAKRPNSIKRQSNGCFWSIATLKTTMLANRRGRAGTLAESQHCHAAALDDSAMTAPILTAAFFLVATTGVHLASLAIAALRLRRAPPGDASGFADLPPVSLVRPLCGIDNFATNTPLDVRAQLSALRDPVLRRVRKGPRHPVDRNADGRTTGSRRAAARRRRAREQQSEAE